jgi:energy-converting hydrogenase Eha subunit C
MPSRAVRPEHFIYLLAAGFVGAAILVSYFLDLQTVGIILFLMGTFMFLLPSMRSPRR